MSTLKVDAIRHNSATSDAITTASDGTCTAKITGMTGGSALSHRNMIINGGMMISQKGTSAAITGGSNSYPLIDRYMAVANSSMTYNVTISQETDNPDGLSKSFKSLTTSAKTPSGSENYIIRTRLEEQDIRRVGFGTSACKKSTLTFWVKSNKTGTYSVMIYLNGFSINLLTTYTISAQNTWEKKTISIPVYTTSYTHPSDNSAGLTFDWHLSSGPDDIVSPHSWQTSATNARAATGQVNILDAVNNYWQITNVQYEVGEVSTSFEYRSVGEELRRCERYFQCLKGPSLVDTGDNEALYGIAFAYTSSRTLWSFIFKTEMRDHPVIAMNTIANLQGLGVVGGWNAATQLLYTNKSSKLGCRVDLNWSGTPFTAGHAVEMRIVSDGILSFDAELA